MASIDKIAIVVTLAVVLVAVGVVAMANSADNAPTQQMNTDVVDARAEAAAQARADAAAHKCTRLLKRRAQQWLTW